MANNCYATSEESIEVNWSDKGKIVESEQKRTSHQELEAPMYSFSESPFSSTPPTVPESRLHGVHKNPSSPSQRQQRPLSTYTSLGSPIRSRNVVGGRIRSASLGNGSPLSNYSPRSSPNSRRVVNSLATGVTGKSLLSQNTAILANAVPPDLSTTRKAMEDASCAERLRARELAEAEIDLSADELRVILKKERLRAGKIQADLAALRCGTAQQQLAAEVGEELRINCLMRRMDVLQEEKGKIIVELEREEEMLTNTLQKKLNEVREEKDLLKKQIQREQNANLVLQSRLVGVKNSVLTGPGTSLEEEDEMEEED